MFGMNQNHDGFYERLERIKDVHDYRMKEGLVERPDGLLMHRSQPRLRFDFPLRGLIFGSLVAIAVKAYLIWVLGHEVYSDAVIGLLNGSGLEQVAGKILMPDGVSLWVVQRYDWLASVYVQLTS